MAFPIEFTMPTGWRAPHPHEAETALGEVLAVRPEQSAAIVADGGLRPDDASLPEIAEETVAALRESGASVDVLSRTELGTPDSPGLAQVLLVEDATETVQCQAFLAMLDVEDSSKRAVLRLAMTTTKEHVAALVGDFQHFLGTVRPPAEGANQGDENQGDEQPPAVSEQPRPRHTRAAAPGEDG